MNFSLSPLSRTITENRIKGLTADIRGIKWDILLLEQKAELEGYELNGANANLDAVAEIQRAQRLLYNLSRTRAQLRESLR
jgi:hypothetical protein